MLKVAVLISRQHPLDKRCLLYSRNKTFICILAGKYLRLDFVKPVSKAKAPGRFQRSIAVEPSADTNLPDFKLTGIFFLFILVFGFDFFLTVTGSSTP